MHYELKLAANECPMQGSLMRMPLLLGKTRGTLYYLRKNTDAEFRNHATYICPNNIENEKLHNLKMWHIRSGHLPFNKIQIIFPELKGKDMNDSCFCTLCPLAKQKRSSFTKKKK